MSNTRYHRIVIDMQKSGVLSLPAVIGRYQPDSKGVDDLTPPDRPSCLFKS